MRERKIMQIEHNDFFNIDKVKKKLDSNGFLRIFGFAAKVGPLVYNDGTEFVSEDELFNQDSMDSIIGVPLTNDHPDAMVNGDNHQGVTIGSVISSKRDGHKLKVGMVIHDSHTIKMIMTGKVQLSCGYRCGKIDKAGIINGVHVDSHQTGRVYNHLALVQLGRAGAECSLKLDSKKMTTENKEVKAESTEAVADAEVKTDNVEGSAPEAVNLDSIVSRLEAIEAKLDAAQADEATEEVKSDEVETPTLASEVTAFLAKLDSVREIDSKITAFKEDGALKSHDELTAEALESAKSISKSAKIESVNARADKKAAYVSNREKFLNS